MTSNTPPPITPNINTNPDSSQDDSNRPQVNVVTQPSQLTQEFELISTPAQQRNRNNLEDDHEDFQLDTDIAFWSWNKWMRRFPPLCRHYVRGILLHHQVSRLVLLLSD